MTEVAPILGSPIVALPLGVVLSLALFRFSRVSAHSVDPDEAALSLLKLAMAVLLRLASAAAILAVYAFVIRSGLAWFGIGLFGGFLLMANFEMYRRGRVSRVRAEHLVPAKKEG